ncbi:C40 family peptidase [Candidatus Zixiibacteriota bacterium]
MVRYRYFILGLILLLAGLLFSGFSGCRSYPRYSNTPTYDKPLNSPEEQDPNRERPRSADLDEALMARIIDDYLGTPYQNGGTSTGGIDCSGLVRNVYYELDGRSMPPDVRRMFRAGTAIEREDLEFGDLVFFSFETRGASHMGIYIGNGKFVHSSETRGVIVSSLDEDTYAENYRGARRPD